MSVTCPYCHNFASLMTGDQLYPGRDDLRYKKFWVCEPCDARCAADVNGKPTSTMANKALRVARMAAHYAIDQLWKKGHMSRSKMYEWLAWAMHLRADDCHVALFTASQCRRAVKLAEGKMKEFENEGD